MGRKGEKVSGRKGEENTKSIGTFSLKEITEELKKKQSAIAAGLVVEGAKVVCSSMAGNPTDSRMDGDSDGEMYLGAFVFNMQKSIMLDHKNIKFSPLFEKCQYSEDELCKPEIEKGEWQDYDENNEVMGGYALIKEKSYMFCTNGGGVLYITNDGQRSEGREIEFAKVTGISEEGFRLLSNIEAGYDPNIVERDSEGNIIAIKNHDVGDGGITVGIGCFVKASDEEKITILEKLGINWQDTSQWVDYETCLEIFNTAESYESKIFNAFLDRNSHIRMSQQQYDALYMFVYNRPALLAEDGTIEELINGNYSQSEWEEKILQEYIMYGGDWNNYGEGWTNRTDVTLEIYFNGIYLDY